MAIKAPAEDGADLKRIALILIQSQLEPNAKDVSNVEWLKDGWRVEYTAGNIRFELKFIASRKVFIKGPVGAEDPTNIQFAEAAKDADAAASFEELVVEFAGSSAKKKKNCNPAKSHFCIGKGVGSCVPLSDKCAIAAKGVALQAATSIAAKEPKKSYRTERENYLNDAGYDVEDATKVISSLEEMGYTPDVNTLGIILRKESGTVFNTEAQGLLEKLKIGDRYTTRYKSSYSASLLLPKEK